MSTRLWSFALVLLGIAFVPLGCGDDDDDDDTDAGADTDTDSDTDSDTDTDILDCDDREAWVAACGAAASWADCAAASATLPDLTADCGWNDAWHYCGWLTLVETTLDSDGGCVFAEQIQVCAHIVVGDEMPQGGAPPCTEDVYDSAFYMESGGATYLGWLSGGAALPDPDALIDCDPLAPDPAICGCICDEDFPIQER